MTTSVSSGDEIGEKRSTQVYRVASSIVGVIPYAGPIIQALISEFIPNTRMDRLDDEQLQLATATEKGLDTFEEGMWQATRALSDERRKRIAALVLKARN